MLALEHTLKNFLKPLAHGTGPLPLSDPWRTLARQARVLGRDGSEAIDHVWTAVHAGHEVMADAKVLARSLVLRVLGISALIFGLRIVIAKITVNDSSYDLIPWWADLALVVSGIATAGFLTIKALFAIPRSWMMIGVTANHSETQFSAAFFAWLEMLVLGQQKFNQTSHAEILETRSELVALKSAELRDGFCREAQRRMTVTELASSLTRRDRAALNRFSSTIPVLDILIAALLTSSFCGVPMVRWLMDSGVS